ncbi:MAG: ABC transporter ATP-binding protein, partial [Methanobrevibacter sp.]|nr:ABC transporter ATP-binding protein [Methanobrevibacter sp.]
DDCFSALDAKTEKIVRENIKKYLKGKTIFMVAQKINTIRGADNIVVLDKGRIVQQGTHEELLKSCNLYQEIYETQSYLDRSDLNGQ